MQNGSMHGSYSQNDNATKDALTYGSGEENSLSLAQIWGLVVRLKWWIVGSVLACLVIALIYIRYATPRYEVYAKILIKDKDIRSKASSSINNTFAELGMMNSSNGFDNELEVLATLTLNRRVVKELDLHTRYYMAGTVKDREIYAPSAPYLIGVDESLIDTLDHPLKFTIEDSDGNLLVTAEFIDPLGIKRKEIHIVKSLPATLVTPYGNFSISRNPLLATRAKRLKDLLTAQGGDTDEVSAEDIAWIENPYQLTRKEYAYVYPLTPITGYFTSNLTIESTSKLTTVADIVMVDNIPQRAKDYLTRLLDAYNEDATYDNNIEAQRTADFIDERLGVITLELGTSEETLEQYKKESGITDLSENAKVDVGQSIAYEQQLVENETQLTLVNYLAEYVAEPQNRYKVIPSNVGLKDNALIAALTKHNETVIERDNLLRAMSENSPQVSALTTQVDGYLAAIKTSLQSMRGQLAMENQSLKSQQQKYSGRISTTPGKERALAEITRQQEVKAGLYLMLLQKREENAITLASAAYKGKLIEEPIASGSPASPRKKVILLIALVIGVALPFGVYYVKRLLRFRVEDAEDLQTLTDVPMLGTVPFVKQLVKSQRAVLIQENRNSLMMEVFRALRMNLPFVLQKGENVILFTSTNSGEGKTVVSSNLAASLAFSGKRVVVVGADIRKPRLAALFNLSDTERGLNDFLSHDATDTAYIGSLLQPSGINSNLYVLPAGPIPPNPAELLERENLGVAIDYLRQRFDYVILDSAPIGIVADTLSVARHADLCVYVVRADYTLRTDIDLLNSLKQSGRLPNMNIVLNAEKIDKASATNRKYGGKYGRSYGKSYGYGYGYGYGHGHGYGYGYGYGYGGKKGEKLPEI